MAARAIGGAQRYPFTFLTPPLGIAPLHPTYRCPLSRNANGRYGLQVGLNEMMPNVSARCRLRQAQPNLHALGRTCISQIERGVSNPSVLVLLKISGILGAEVQELFVKR